MRPWQLYLDESGNFDDPNEAVLVAGVLFEGRALPQQSAALRARLAGIFVGSAYPPHAAHHNIAASLLCEALAGRAPEGPAASRLLRAIERALPIAQGSASPEARTFREAVLSGEPRLRVPVPPLRTFDVWLRKAAPEAHQALVQERDAQRVDLVRFAAEGLHAGTPNGPLVVAAWQGGGTPTGTADARYEALYETLLERALAFAAHRDVGADLQVHLATRHRHPPPKHVAALNQADTRALGSALLRRAKGPSRALRFSAEVYGAGVAPGIVLADFASNTLFSALRAARSWDQAHASLRDGTGLVAQAHCALLPLAAALPCVAAEGPLRDAIRNAAEGLPVPPLSGPTWAREQATAWISALTAEVTR